MCLFSQASAVALAWAIVLRPFRVWGRSVLSFLPGLRCRFGLGYCVTSFQGCWEYLMPLHKREIAGNFIPTLASMAVP